MKNVLLFFLFLACNLTNAQQKKDTTELLEYKPRWYLNNVRDSTKVKEDIKKAIEQTKPKPKIKLHNRVCLLDKTKKPLRKEVVF